MRVLQVIDSLHWGGVQQLQITFATAARNSDISLSLASLRADEDTPYRACLEDLDVSVSFFPSRKLLNWKRILALSRWMKREDFDLVHTHLPYANIVGALAARLANIPVIATLHVPNVDSTRLRRALNEWTLQHWMQEVIAVGASVAETFPGVADAHHIHIIHNAVRLPQACTAEERTQTRHEIMGSHGGPVLISVGRLDEAKGFDDLLRGVSLIRKKHPSLRVWIVGAGNYLPLLQSRIESQGLSEYVNLLGARADVPRLLAASDVYVSTSRVEGMSISMLEAMAAGLPVVATCAGENSRLVLPTTGVLISIGDIQALADGLDRLLSSPSLRVSLGVEAISIVMQSYNVETWFRQIRSVYLNAVKERP